jgi:hypothetical protein
MSITSGHLTAGFAVMTPSARLMKVFDCTFCAGQSLTDSPPPNRDRESRDWFFVV